MWSLSAVAKNGHLLRTDGPYRITRHPIYSGMLAMLLGSVMLAGLGRWTLVFAAGVVMLLAKIRQEEQLLAETFPGEYERYRREVPQLIPGWCSFIRRRR